MPVRSAIRRKADESNQREKLVESSLDRNYYKVNRNVTLVVFVSAILTLINETYAYHLNEIPFLFRINALLIIVLLVNIGLFLGKKIGLYLAFGILLYTIILNVTVSHIYEIRLENFNENVMRTAFFGLLMTVLGALVLGRTHAYIILSWLVLLIAFDIYRTRDDFIIENFGSIAIVTAGLALCVNVYVRLMKKAFRENQKSLIQITSQKQQINRKAAELTKANDNLKELQQLQNDLIEMIVHDMKNPLNIILNYSGAGISASGGKQINEAGRQMLVLVENMLDVHRMEHVKPEMKYRSFPLRELISASLKQVEFLLEQKRMAVDVVCESNLELNSDRDILERVLVNLMTNAIKFTPMNSGIKISAVSVKEDSSVLVEVKDSGKGIPSEYKDKVFEKFIQVVARKSGDTRSTGLGLAFCRMSIEYLGGRIWVSDTSGSGTTISFTLPCESDSGAARPDIQVPERKQTVLSAADRKQVGSVVSELRKLDIYKAGKIFESLQSIDGSENESLRQWADDLKKSVYSANKEVYDSLLEQADHGD